jgi:ribulose-phosphate 3-epimerase
MFEIIPAILEKEWVEIEKKIELVKPFAKTIHIDIIDGNFADNITFLDPSPFKKYTSDLFFELHMMVKDPINYIDAWAKAGFQRFLGHIEKMPDQAAFVTKVKEVGEVGLALDGPTAISEIKVPLIDLDTLLIYTSDKAGFSGPAFVSERLGKVRDILKKESTLILSVDGGINENTIEDAFLAGAQRFGVNSGIFNTDDSEMAYRKLVKIGERLLINGE